MPSDSGAPGGLPALVRFVGVRAWHRLLHSSTPQAFRSIALGRAAHPGYDFGVWQVILPISAVAEFARIQYFPGGLNSCEFSYNQLTRASQLRRCGLLQSREIGGKIPPRLDFHQPLHDAG